MPRSWPYSSVRRSGGRGTANGSRASSNSAKSWASRWRTPRTRSRRSVRTAMPACSVVLDASVILRAFVDADQGAHAWFTRIDEEDVAAAWPDLVFAETAHGVARYVRTGRLTREEGLLVVHRALSAPVQSARTG